ncbi:MAG: hypothetical protein GY842_16275 [bacterium]|nr:hypothetical protein [bacterium]
MGAHYRTGIALIGLAGMWLTDVRPAVAAEGRKTPVSFDTPVADTTLWIAFSKDGLSFAERGERFVAHAAAPAVARLPDGSLLALFDYAVGPERPKGSVLAGSRSKDEGRSWTPIKPVRLDTPRAPFILGGRVALLEAEGEGTRLYYVDTPSPSRPKSGGPPGRTAEAILRSAYTHDGLRFRSDPTVKHRLGSGPGRHPTMVRVRDRVHLYTAELTGPAQKEQAKPAVTRHAVSRDGRRFTPTSPARTQDAVFVGSVVQIGTGLRAYVSSGEGVRSASSADGRRWQTEPGLRIPAAWDPAVTRLRDGSYLMIYCTAPDRERALPSEGNAEAFVTQPASTGPGAPADQHDAWYEELAEYSLVPPPDEEDFILIGEADLSSLATVPVASGDLGMPSPEGTPSAETQSSSRLGAPSRPGDVDSPSLPSSQAARMSGATAEAEPGSADTPLTSDGIAGEALDDPYGFAPRADLDDHVDYVGWFREHVVEDVEDNAYDAYMEFMPVPWDPPGSGPVWPELVNMFSDRAHDLPPGPWSPTAHPEWAASSDAAQDLLNQYRQASRHEDYSVPLEFGDERLVETPDEEPMLFEMLLPHLSSHRNLAKATLADAWRTEDGQVSAEGMLDAFETVLRNANHVGSGYTIIENLVAAAERSLVQKNARWALKHEIFDERQMSQALELLQQLDHDDTDPARYMQGEHAVEMQTVQYVFGGADPDRPDPQAARVLAGLVGGESPDPEQIDPIMEMNRDDAYDAIDAFDGYCRDLTEQMRIGYPEVRAADLDASAERYVHTNMLTETLLPALSRMHKIRARYEASQRATQLTYAAHLFEAQRGRWPASLDELPDEYGPVMRTDPFTGRDFGYRLGDSGPTIYSLSENATDDGGIHAPRWDDQVTSQSESDDYVFWPPQDGR